MKAPTNYSRKGHKYQLSSFCIFWPCGRNQDIDKVLSDIVKEQNL